MPNALPPRVPFLFVLRIRHPDLVVRLDEQQQFLRDLFGSLEAQTDRRFGLAIVCNKGQVLPPLPDFGAKIELDMPLDLRVRDAETLEERAEAVRRDRGLKTLPMVRGSDPDTLIMCVDDDDFVSRRLVGFVLGQDRLTGWVVDKGYVWTPDNAFMNPLDQFHRLCGTSVIAPARYFRAVRGGYSEEDVIRELGSHRIVVDEAEEAGNEFRRIPFPGAVYRQGHANSAQADVQRIAAAEQARAAPPPLHRQVIEGLRTLRRRYLPAKRTLLTGPKIDAETRVPITDEVRAEFFGGAVVGSGG